MPEEMTIVALLDRLAVSKQPERTTSYHATECDSECGKLDSDRVLVTAFTSMRRLSLTWRGNDLGGVQISAGKSDSGVP